MAIAALTPQEFERVLDAACETLTAESRGGAKFEKSIAFENRVREVLVDLVAPFGIRVDFDPHAYVFPDIVLGAFGVEVKFTAGDSWRSVANSVFESTRSADVRHVYVLYGKMGGTPEVKWGRYEDSVIHVRTSHMPRFEVEIPPTREPLFKKMGVTYDEFSRLPIEERMQHVREYARGRLRQGEHLWWLEDQPEPEHSLPLKVELYMELPQEKKRRLRAEVALLCPQVVKPSRAKNKYNDAAMYLITYHGVLAPQARDLFSAGSVALRADSKRGGLYIMRALKDIEVEMRQAAETLDDALFVEYWGKSVPKKERIREWLRRADEYARDWKSKPSAVLFR